MLKNEFLWGRNIPRATSPGLTTTPPQIYIYTYIHTYTYIYIYTHPHALGPDETATHLFISVLVKIREILG